MSNPAIATMVLGMVVIWGGLATSVILTLRGSRRRPPDRPS